MVNYRKIETIDMMAMNTISFKFSNFADAFIQSDLQLGIINYWPCWLTKKQF